jgi:hypothetical protein
VRLFQLVVQRLDPLPQRISICPQLLDVPIAIGNRSLCVVNRFLNAVGERDPVRDHTSG